MANANASTAEAHGRHADSPTKIPMEGWKDILWRLYQEFNQDRVMLVAAGVTYYLLLALVPGLTAFVSIYGLFNDPATVNDQVNNLAGVLPQGGLEIIQDQLTRLTQQNNSTLGIALLVSLAIALWSASAGIKSLFDAMNIAYDEEERRNFFVLNGTALLFTLGAVVTIVLFIGVVLVLPGILSVLNLGGLEWVVQIVSYLVMVGVLSLGVSALYRWGPSRRQAKWRWITPGTILAVVLTVVVSLLFTWYAANFSNYNATYGSLGGLIGFLTWIWLTVTVLIIGAELNSEIEHQTAADSTIGESKPMGKRGATMADELGAIRGKGKTSGDADTMDGEPEPEPYRQKRRFSAGTLAMALPAALVLNWAKKRNER